LQSIPGTLKPLLGVFLEKSEKKNFGAVYLGTAIGFRKSPKSMFSGLPEVKK
jgi:hypothetical protein